MISKAWYVRCDGCGDPVEISTESAKHARELARHFGYVRRREDGEMADLCPRCAKENAA